MIVATYNEWRDGTLLQVELSESKAMRLVKCAKCKGEGDVECSCCDSLSSCEECEGEGKVDIDDLPSTKHLFTAKEYYDEVTTDIKKACAFTNKSFFREVLPFIRVYRKQFGKRRRKYPRRLTKLAA
ncbi:MAG: hypothetical protein MJK10_03990 [Pseudomonadales bacterium]|nr:hypothetical protein [Pseudomonadales bacterium]NRA15234.1 hypothetical protein [Oceanospirillaceae bacterium]